MCLWKWGALLVKELRKACEDMAIIYMSGIHKINLT